jgi:hypothetical protein
MNTDWTFIAIAALVLALILGIFMAVDSNRSNDCEDRGGMYARGGKGGSDICYAKDGSILKVY